MKINTNSWHFKLISEVLEIQPNTPIMYIYAVVLSLLVSAVVLVMTLFMVFSLFIVTADAIAALVAAYLYGGYVLLESPGVIWLSCCVVAFCALYLFDLLYKSDDTTRESSIDYVSE